ncbi:phosphoserine transaminase [Aurantiacibacter xanthus]|uniref:phosphoserine transaminase n=1 Tax=Aurantiacibacter xanthus TaxID=1784712 RepID=UPI001C729373|nr:phosphoserine transaminase [Aurantiacibacter xanthus]
MPIDLPKPQRRPERPYFSSGPSAKRPGWEPRALAEATVGRSHRSAAGKNKIRQVLDLTREVLGIPEDYGIAIVPGSDTGAMEMVLWSMLGQRGVDVLSWESFGAEWLHDILRELRLDDVRSLTAPYGALPVLADVDPARDTVFTWNGTTSGVRVPDGDWIADDRAGLTICDATSAAFGMELPWRKLDVVTWSWQKVLGGEGAHGVVVMSPRAVERLESYVPPRPLPKLFRVVSNGKVAPGFFAGDTLNTPSLLVIEDAIDGLLWAQSIGGLAELVRRCEANLASVDEWVRHTDWIEFLAQDPATRSCTAICLRIADPAIAALGAEEQAAFVRTMVTTLEQEGVAYDIASYRAAPPGLRLWSGATVENGDMVDVLPWLDWAFRDAMAKQAIRPRGLL